MKSMRKLLPVVMIATFIVACKKNNDNPNAVNATDKSFLTQTYLASKTEIQLGKLALAKTSNPNVQSFGQRIITSYKEMQSELMAVADKINFPISDTAFISGQSATPLIELSAPSFDAAYMRNAASNHRNILDQFQNELSNGNNTYVRYYFLNKYIDKIRAYYIEADSISRRL